MCLDPCCAGLGPGSGMPGLLGGAAVPGLLPGQPDIASTSTWEVVKAHAKALNDLNRRGCKMM